MLLRSPAEVEAWLLEVSGGETGWVRSLACKLMEFRKSQPAVSGKSFGTPWGGVFLLLPGALEIGIEDWPPVVRLLGLAKCLGGQAIRETLYDPVLRLVAGCEEPTDWDAIVRYSEAAARFPVLDLAPDDAEINTEFFRVPSLAEDFDRFWSGAAAAVLRNLARRLYGFDRSSPNYLVERFLRTDCIVTVSAECIEARLERCDLDIVLRMAGFDGREFRLPWLNPELVRIRLAG
jgi:hypothetical protein